MPLMTEFVKPEGTFAVYGSVALLETSVLYLVLAEIKNKTLQEIRVSFQQISRIKGTKGGCVVSWTRVFWEKQRIG